MKFKKKNLYKLQKKKQLELTRVNQLNLRHGL